jgi:hypothetical protein
MNSDGKSKILLIQILIQVLMESSMLLSPWWKDDFIPY